MKKITLWVGVAVVATSATFPVGAVDYTWLASPLNGPLVVKGDSTLGYFVVHGGTTLKFGPLCATQLIVR